MYNKNKGFTLVEMLVVIAIIAVLVAIIVPTAVGATKKASAAADAANLRSVLGEANAGFIIDDIEAVKAMIRSQNIKSKMYPDAEIVLGYIEPAVYDIFFKDTADGKTVYYNMNYFADFAQTGQGTVLTESDLTQYRLEKVNE